MMRISRELVVSLLLLAFPVACGGGGGGGGTLPPESFAPELLKASCAQNFKCCDADELASLMLTSQAECESMSAFVLLLLGDLKAAVAAKRAVYDPAKGKACVDALESASCGTSSDPMVAMKAYASCLGAVMGQVAVGGGCTSAWDCTLGSACYDGICTAAGKAGETCAFSSDCSDELYCAADDKCAAKKAVGAACVDDDECVSGSCVTDKCFAAPLMCDGK